MKVDNIQVEISTLPIWAHQKDALREILLYFNRYDGKAYLVKMPTGTGKTGVFACLSRIAFSKENFLIVTPSTALNHQIIREIQNDFWEKIKYDQGKLNGKQIVNLLPSNVGKVLHQIADKSFILVTTIQSLQAIAKSDAASFSEIKRLVDYLVFDEGHKEPAYTWGETIRSLKKATVLFSATPYRNDAKIFNFDKENFYCLDHNWCEKNRILRRLSIHDLNIPTHKPGPFVTGLLSELKKLEPALKKQGIENAKVVIRCEEKEEIVRVVAALKKLKKRVIGIHERFKKEGDFTDVVPSKADQNKYDFFVHQFKLVEGIDNPDFCIVALYRDFGSTRMLIQQIGRILRNPSLKDGQFGYLFTLNPKKIKQEWDKYLEYDETINKRKRLFDVSDVLKVNRETSTLYFSGTFRELVDVNNIHLSQALLFQKKVNIYQYADFTPSEIATLVTEEWNRRDYSILKIENIDDKTFLILYIIYDNSPLVKDGVFIEQKLACTYVRVEGELIYCYDTELNNPFSEVPSIDPVPREKLINLFSKKRKVTRTYLLNTEIGNSNFRSKDISAYSVEFTAPGLADHGYFPSRMEGVVENGTGIQRRYLGFQNGRITDFSAGRIEFEDFEIWVKEIHKELHTAVPNAPILSFMNRFAQKIDAPPTTDPISILLDIDQEIIDQFVYGSTKADLEFNDTCAVVKDGFFVLTINDHPFTFEIVYRPEFKKYFLHCDELNELIKNIEEDGPTLLAILNASQAFRIIIKGNKYAYAYKTFFKPGLNLITKSRDLDLKQMFHRHPCITAIKSEKGNNGLAVAGNVWHKDTLFGLIARAGIGYADKVLESAFCFDYILCDDLGNEIADFIAIDEKGKKLAFIHVKAGKSKLSASSFQEVCGQAVKNLDYLVPYYAKDPNINITKWGKPWSLDGVGKANRIVKGTITPTAFWNKYKGLISDPSLTKEVWLCVGNMLDYDAFEKEFKKTKIEDVKPEAIQLVYLLRSTWNSVSSVGGHLKIFC